SGEGSKRVGARVIPSCLLPLSASGRGLGGGVNNSTASPGIMIAAVRPGNLPSGTTSIMKTARTAKLPPFYTHPSGSLPPPPVVRDLLARRGELPPAELRRTLDDLVRFAIRLQEQAGLDVVSDGEWRRTQYIREFLDRVGGFERCRPFTHQGETKFTDVVVRRMTASAPVFALDARFLVEHTDRVTKFALPSPFLIAIRYWHEDYSRD